MDTHQRIARHHGAAERLAKRDPVFANARPANLARSIAKQVTDAQDADAAASLDRRLLGIFPGGGESHHSNAQDPSNDSGTGFGFPPFLGGGGGGSNSGGGGNSGGGSGGGGGHSGGGGGSTGGTGGGTGGGGTGGTGGTGTGGGNTGGTGTGTGGGGHAGAGDGAGAGEGDDSDKGAVSRDNGPTTAVTSTSTTLKVSSTTVKPISIVTPTVTTPMASFVPQTSQAVVAVGAPTTDLSQPTDLAAPIDAGSSSKGPQAGLVIGIVAGALAGAAVLFVIAGWLWRKYGKKADPYEANPFDRDDFQRHSAMLPDNFDDDDLGPSMSEHHNFSPHAASYSEDAGGMAGAGLLTASAAAGVVSTSRNNESSGPRPPTMFQRHINGQLDYSQGSGAPPVPQVGAVFDPGYPAMPPVAYGGGDPYGAAGVASMSNVSNPYAHLDRGTHEQYAADHNGLDRSGSHGSYSGYGSAQENPAEYDTAGRPGTGEGRSGTPDIPNVQQTFDGVHGNEDMLRMPPFNSPPSEPLRNPFEQEQYHQQQQAYHHQQQQASLGSYGQAAPADAHAHNSLSVRNLMPGNGGHYQQHQQQQRPVSVVSDAADPDDAYGGVY